MIEKWAAVMLLVERMTLVGKTDDSEGLVIPVMVPLVVPTLFRYPEGRENPLELTWFETRRLTVEMGRAVNGAWPDKASRNYWLVGIIPHSDAPPAAARPAWAVEWDLGEREAPIAGVA